MSLSLPQLLIILLIILLLFGAGKLPKVMSDLGKGLRSFKSSLEEEEKATKDKKEENDQQN